MAIVASSSGPLKTAGLQGKSGTVQGSVPFGAQRWARLPSWAKLVELVAVLSPGRAAYVNFDLEPGRDVALCLIDDPRSHKLHAQLGMIGEFSVAGA
jgi:hypothetical protein